MDRREFYLRPRVVQGHHSRPLRPLRPRRGGEGRQQIISKNVAMAVGERRVREATGASAAHQGRGMIADVLQALLIVALYLAASAWLFWDHF